MAATASPLFHPHRILTSGSIPSSMLRRTSCVSAAEGNKRSPDFLQCLSIWRVGHAPPHRLPEPSTVSPWNFLSQTVTYVKATAFISTESQTGSFPYRLRHHVDPGAARIVRQLFGTFPKEIGMFLGAAAIKVLRLS